VTGVWRSTDGGEFVASRPIAAGDGSLILADTRRTLVSDDEAAPSGARAVHPVG
jgi:hypothetical protein